MGEPLLLLDVLYCYAFCSTLIAFASSAVFMTVVAVAPELVVA